jgi:hypothetical protein
VNPPAHRNWRRWRELLGSLTLQRGFDMSFTRTVAAGCALAVLAAPLFAGAAQAHCRQGARRTHVAHLYGAPHRTFIRSSFVEGPAPYGGAFVQPVALRREIVVEGYRHGFRPEIGAGEAIEVARRHGLAELKSAEHHGGHWTVKGWTWDGRWVDAQVYGDGRLKNINFEG